MAARPFQRDGLRQDSAQPLDAAASNKAPHQSREPELAVEDLAARGFVLLQGDGGVGPTVENLVECISRQQT
jgi:hypothetical protein